MYSNSLGCYNDCKSESILRNRNGLKHLQRAAVSVFLYFAFCRVVTNKGWEMYCGQLFVLFSLFQINYSPFDHIFHRSVHLIEYCLSFLVTKDVIK